MVEQYTLGADLLRVENVHVKYNGVPVLRGVNFSIKDITRPGKCTGQIDAILAPSGLGKSTLFRCISGLMKPDSGSVYLNGDTVPVHVGQVGVVAQDYPLFEHLPVMANLMLAATRKQKDRKTAKEKIMELLERFSLADKIDNYPHELSGGQRQRIAIIQQILCSGHLMLMDEPYSGLDIIAKEAVLNLIQSVAAADELNSVIVTTHDIPSAIAGCDTIYLLGRERDSNGGIIPGAYIRYQYNLMDLGLAWHPDVTEMPEFFELQKEIRARFKEL